MAAPFMNGLNPDLRAKIRERGMARTYQARSYIFYEGDPGGSVYLVESGLLRIDRTTRSGRVTLLDLAIEGDLIGELSVIDDSPRSATLSTVTETRVRHIPGPDFRALVASEPALQTAVIERLARRIRELSTQLLEASTMDAPRRIAARLLHLVEIEKCLGRLPQDVSGHIELRLPISQQELGEWSGLAREGAVKGLGTLRSLGLITTGRKRVEIMDLDSLEDFSD